MTLLEAVNRVLIGLREAQVADLTATYSIHVVQMINMAKQDIEDMGPWKTLRTTVSKTLTPATSTISLTTETNERSYLLYKNNMGLAYLTTADKERTLQVVSLEELQANQLLVPDQPNDIPCLVAFARASAGLTAHFWPTPDAAYTVKFVIVVPQDDFVASTDAAVAISIPAEPVWRVALATAMEERGEEFSGSLDAVRARASRAVDQAVLMDFGAEPMTFEAE